MSWHFSRALVVEYSAGTSLDGVPSAPSNGSPTPQLYLSPDRMTAFSRLSRFGMTFAPLTDDLGAELLTWFRAGFPVRTFQQPERAPESTGHGRDSGGKWPASLAKYDPATASWKTAQYSLLGDSEPFSETWPRWGMTAGGESFRLPTPERPTSEKESGLWQTPVSDDSVNRTEGKFNSRGEPKLSAQVRWASPASADAVGSHGGGQGRSLRTDIHNWKRGLWPTPLSTDATHGGPNQRDSSGRLGLTAQAMRWPTPQSRDYFPPHTPEYIAEKKAQGHGMSNLNDRVAGGKSTPPTYPTPTAVTNTGGAAMCKWGGSGAREKLRKVVTPAELNGSLNPEWVEWLMGWPLGWTDLKPLATDRFQRWLDSHGRR